MLWKQAWLPLSLALQEEVRQVGSGREGKILTWREGPQF